ncbi:hypothetical protein COU01_04410 [Candidatus Falkowbacteria bacterium CG10_big_fil_rev_8_21_14_0_10_44_15]|uniref:Big-1 domain-containing protein n=1 Tax=Candidatus Falkowbacteria bacterium CG10_big_fil_rev_8_21_14_0_10_44_15 TaxID=1974569 RepID=A0A2H0UYQ0_9BACT|nr:MAG: hypothetical protein COU01_04410 [Candidatus Falkowbacteria bacterium CG10_big_fil_rev_8_21_14_0_10_44_15]
MQNNIYYNEFLNNLNNLSKKISNLMQKILSNLAKKTNISLLLLAVLFAISASFSYGNYVFAAATVAPASGGSSISLDNSSAAQGGGSYNTINPITINESAIGEIKLGSHNFNLPSQWELDQNSPITITLNWEQSGMGISNDYSFYPQTPYFFFVNVDIESNLAPASLIFSGIKVRPTGSTPTNSLKITHSGNDIVGVTNGNGDGVTGTNFGLLTAVAGSANKIVITDPADATVGGTTNVTIAVQDQFGNRVSGANDQAVAITVSGSARISGVTTGAGDGAYNSTAETITSSNGQIVVAVTDATAETINIDVNHATLDHSSTQNIVFAAAPQPPAGGGSNPATYSNYGSSSGGGTTYTAPANPDVQTTSRPLVYASADGTQVNGAITTTSNRGQLADTTLQANISLGSPINNDQIFTLNTSGLSSAREISANLTSVFLRGVIASYGGGRGIRLTISAHAASDEQKSASALDGLYLFDYAVFPVSIAVENNEVVAWNYPVQLTFDVSNIEYPREVSIARYDRTNNRWVDLGGSANGTMVSVAVNQLGDFGVIRTLEQRRRVDNLRASGVAATSPQAEVLGVRIDNNLSESDYLSAAGDVNTLLGAINVKRNLAQERLFYNANVKSLIRGMQNLTAANINSYTNFITYGSASTLKLGAGERAGVLNSYKSAFGKLPITARDWQDAINIATGRWTAERSTAAEAQAARTFRQIYRREPNLTDAHDDAAINVIAYGLRPSARNLQSEQAAIRIFRGIFRHSPVSVTDWDAVRAIAYSGAKR